MIRKTSTSGGLRPRGLLIYEKKNDVTGTGAGLFKIILVPLTATTNTLDQDSLFPDRDRTPDVQNTKQILQT